MEKHINIPVILLSKSSKRDLNRLPKINEEKSLVSVATNTEVSNITYEKKTLKDIPNKIPILAETKKSEPIIAIDKNEILVTREIKPKKLITGAYNTHYILDNYNYAHFYHPLLPFQEKMNKSLGRYFSNYGTIYSRKEFLNKPDNKIFLSSIDYGLYYKLRCLDRKIYLTKTRPKLRALTNPGKNKKLLLAQNLFNNNRNSIIKPNMRYL